MATSSHLNQGDERGMQRNIFEGKHKFEPSMRKENKFRSKRVNEECKDPRFHDEDIFKSGVAVKPENPYFVWRSTGRKTKTLNLPKKVIDYYNLSTLNSLSLVDERGNEWKTKFIKWSDGRMACSNVGWKKLCRVNRIKKGDRCICECIQGNNSLALHVRVIRARALTRSTYKNECDKNAQDGSRMQSTVRKDKTLIEGGKFKQIDEETLDLDPPNESGYKTEDAEQRSNLNQGSYVKELKGIIKTLISKDVNQKRVMFSCHKNYCNSSSSDSSGSDIDRPNSLKGTSIGSLLMMAKRLPEKLEVLQSYFQIVHVEANLSITLQNDVLGKKYNLHIFLEDVNKFCFLEPISDCCIISYMWYIHRKMKKEKLVHKFRFVNPKYISYTFTRDQRARTLADRLIGASTDQLVLAPCDVGIHWILTVIEPYNNTVFLLDPLSQCIRDEVWQDVVNEALSMFSASKGDNEKKSPKWAVIEAPLPPDSKQCGFYIMRYMKEIIESCRGLGSISLQSMFTKDSYSTSEIDEMRIEWAEWLLDHIG